MDLELAKKFNLLKEKLVSLKTAVVAYSGGADSTLLAKVASDVLGTVNVVAVTATSSTYSNKELEQAQKIARELGIRHKLLVSEELEIENFAENPPERCYFCKHELFGKLEELAKSEGLNYVLDGSNLDDAGDFRPGMKAAKERGVISPLKETGFTKHDIRELSRELGLPTWNKPAMACLSSRFPYGERITPEKLSRVDWAEEFLREHGFPLVRVRHHDKIARIEVPQEDFQSIVNFAVELNRFLQELGFTYVTLDLGGYRSGSMNEVLTDGGQ